MRQFTIGNAHHLFAGLHNHRDIIGYQIADDYWHSELFLRFDNDVVLQFSTVEHSLAPLFDCYTLTITEVPKARVALSEMILPFRINNVFALRRAEWLIPAPSLDDVTIGNHPHMQMFGLPGMVPEEAVASAVIVAGVLLQSVDARQIAIIASESVPLNVDFLHCDEEISAMLEHHEIIGNSSV